MADLERYMACVSLLAWQANQQVCMWSTFTVDLLPCRRLPCIHCMKHSEINTSWSQSASCVVLKCAMRFEPNLNSRVACQEIEPLCHASLPVTMHNYRWNLSWQWAQGYRGASSSTWVLLIQRSHLQPPQLAAAACTCMIIRALLFLTMTVYKYCSVGSSMASCN